MGSDMANSLVRLANLTAPCLEGLYRNTACPHELSFNVKNPFEGVKSLPFQIGHY